MSVNTLAPLFRKGFWDQPDVCFWVSISVSVNYLEKGSVTTIGVISNLWMQQNIIGVITLTYLTPNCLTLFTVIYFSTLTLYPFPTPSLMFPSPPATSKPRRFLRFPFLGDLCLSRWALLATYPLWLCLFTEAWLSFSLKLISTYKWVYAMFDFLGLDSLTQNDYFLFYLYLNWWYHCL